ncbi:MAG: hypothetical protein KGQ40_09660, partial [Rhodospirillales bacterium]|nr:hypothetical protein [Rhodospirillales bacterium]
MAAATATEPSWVEPLPLSLPEALLSADCWEPLPTPASEALVSAEPDCLPTLASTFESSPEGAEPSLFDALPPLALAVALATLSETPVALKATEPVVSTLVEVVATTPSSITDTASAAPTAAFEPAA